MIRVYVVDDHAVVRDGLGRIIQAMPDLELVGTAADVRTALDDARAGAPWDVVVMDLSLPGGGGVELLDQLKAIARVEGLSLNALVARIDEARAGGLSGAARIYVLDWIMANGPPPLSPSEKE